MRILSFKTDLLTIPYVIEDSLSALRKLGHTTRVLSTANIDSLPKEYLKNLIEEIISFRPDFIFTVDHVGIVPKVFNQLKIPYASWFIDEPKRCLYPFRHLDKEELTKYCLPFVCDRAYIKDLKEFGFKDAFYLPLAANPSIFKEMELDREDEERFGCNISFAGGSDSAYYRRYCLEPKDERIQILIDEMIKTHIQNPERDMTRILEETEERFPYTFSFKDNDHKRFVLLGLEFAAMTKYRKEMLESINDLGLVLYGDKGWLEVMGNGIGFKGWIENRTELPKLYNASKINLNMTKSQSKTCLNMRVFEVLSCGGFLLTDYREDLKRLFRIDEEVVCYRNKEELREKAEYYLGHPQERKEIARRAQARVLAEHTYKHRMEILVEVIQRTFG